MDIFDWKTYLVTYPDLQLAGIKDKISAYRHWIKFGKKEGRIYFRLQTNTIDFNIDISRFKIVTVLCNFTNDTVDFEKYNYFIENYDFYYISNFQTTTNNKKINVIIDNLIDKTNYLNVEVLQNYDYIICLDSPYDNVQYIHTYIKNFIASDKNILLFKHEIQNIKNFISYNKYEKFNYNDLKTQIKLYLNKKITFFYSSNYIIKNNKIIKNILEKCWQEIKLDLILADIYFSEIFNNNMSMVDINTINFIPHSNLNLKNVNNYINGIDYIVWINLERSPHRKQHMNLLLNDIIITNQRISAIDGINFNFKNNIFNMKLSRTFSDVEKACTLSHLKAINMLKDKEGEYFMICEDDISFENIFLFNTNLKQIINDSPDFDILMLSKIYYDNLKELYTKWNSSIAGTGCYLITKKAILKICSYVSYNNDNDTFIFNDNLKKSFEVADIYIYDLVNTYAYKYNYISTLDEDSTIHKHHLNNHKKSSTIQKKLILDDIFI